MWRDTELYKSLTPYTATLGEWETEEEQLTAWQYIWDNRLLWDGFTTRMCRDLLEDGLIEP